MPSWSCKKEPVVCPPHGVQTEVCIDVSCDQKRESQSYCSPGECAGCYASRWQGWDTGPNKCIPYGFRVEHFVEGTGDSGEYSQDRILYENESGEEYILEISEDSALLTLLKIEEDLTSYTLFIGEEIEIFFDDYSADVRYFIITNDIVNLEGNKGYVDITFREEWSWKTDSFTMDAYCDLDGTFKNQKIKDSSGGWASCQNNYECFSNVCSGGECVEVNDLLQQTNAFNRLVIRIVCKIVNPISGDGYNSCIGDFLGNIEGQI